MLLLIAMAQAAPSTAPPTAPSPQRIDLTLIDPCGHQAAADADVVVCGRRGDQSSRYRLPPLPPSQPNDGKAQWQVGEDTVVSAETEQIDIGGRPSNRVMLRLKFKF